MQPELSTAEANLQARMEDAYVNNLIENTRANSLMR